MKWIDNEPRNIVYQEIKLEHIYEIYLRPVVHYQKGLNI
jgi:hypothetical protein